MRPTGPVLVDGRTWYDYEIRYYSEAEDKHYCVYISAINSEHAAALFSELKENGRLIPDRIEGVY